MLAFQERLGREPVGTVDTLEIPPKVPLAVTPRSAANGRPDGAGPDPTAPFLHVARLCAEWCAIHTPGDLGQWYGFSHSAQNTWSQGCQSIRTAF